ncbi:unnamed protein product, partial [Candidula unifasciata]
MLSNTIFHILSDTIFNILSDTIFHILSDTIFNILSDTIFHILSDTIFHILSNTFCRGANIGSDHNLCIAKLKIKLKSLLKPPRNKKINLQALLSKDHQSAFNAEILTTYVTKTSNADTTNNIDKNWDFFKNTLTNAAVNTVGYVQKQKKKWLSDNTWSKIQERKQAKLTLLSKKDTSSYEKYSTLDKEVKSNARKDKQNFIHDLAFDAETAAKIGNNKAVFHIMKQLCNHSPTLNTPIKDKQGKLLLSDDQQTKRWAEHFKEILNRPNPDIIPNLEEEIITPTL